MLTIRWAGQSKRSQYPIPLYLFHSVCGAATSTSFAGNKQAAHLAFTSYPYQPTSASSPPQPPLAQASDLLIPFKQWFLSRKNPFMEEIFQILRMQDGAAAHAALGRLNLRLSDSLVLDVLKYGKSEKDLLSCIRFFDWAGQQAGFQLTTATFHAMIRILSMANQSLVVEFSEEQKYSYHINFHTVLVVGYSVAGKVDLALKMFGRMRFQGLDLDCLAYHILLDALVERGYFGVVDTIADQIRLRGLQNGCTYSILVKSLCKQNELDRAEEYIRHLMVENLNTKKGLNGILVATFVDALCKDKQFERAARLVEEIKELGTVSLERTYGVWIERLVQAGKIDEALKFFKGKKELEGYVPDVFRYNTLLRRLLRQHRLDEVFNLLIEMQEHDVLPDGVTLSATLTFFCKVGMLDIAMGLYNSRADFGLSVNAMAYNYLINSLFGDANVDNACGVLENAIEQGYFPGTWTFSIIADVLCRERKLDTLRELVNFSLEKDFHLSQSIYDRFISTLCASQKLQDGYLLCERLNRLDKIPGKNAYASLIRGCYKAGRGDLAAKLLIEMQEKGHEPGKQLFRTVTYGVCKMDNSKEQFFRLLDIQTLYENSSHFYNFFISGAGLAGKVQWADEVYLIMKRSGIEPNLKSDILMLQCYLKNDKITDALTFFHNRRGAKKKLWHTLIVGLCKAQKPDSALHIFQEMRANQLKPSIECYEELVKLLCNLRRYTQAIEIVDDLLLIGRGISSFVGNIMLLHSLELFTVWGKSRNLQNSTTQSQKLGKLMYAFSLPIRSEVEIVHMEGLIRECFPLDSYTYDMLLQKVSLYEINLACKYLNLLYKMGHEPNWWGYVAVVNGLEKSGRTAEARKLREEMIYKGFNLPERARLYL